MAEDDKEKMPQDTPPAPEQPTEQEKAKPARRHLIRHKWLRVTLKTLMWIVVAVLMIPVLLYIPPVQTAVKNLACKIVRGSTGMDVEIGEFRLKWPLDVSLRDVTVIEATGDTMAAVGELVADVRLLPLLKLDVKLNRLDLMRGYYRMVSPDSSMILKIRAGLLTVDDRSSADLASMDINLHQARIKDGDLQLVMDVWKKKATPNDTAPTAMRIRADRLDLDNFRFGMSMLPTIDTLQLDVRHLALRGGDIDLAANKVAVRSLAANGGEVTYLTPDTAWVRLHPAPENTDEGPASPPMVITGDSVSLTGFTALYGMKGAEPKPGFDPSWMQLEGVAVGLRDFYNAASDLRLPVTRLEATERSGLQVTRGTGTVILDEAGIKLDSLAVSTLWSQIGVTADIPFALMELKPEAPLLANARGWLGIPDIEAFMPDVKEYTSRLGVRNPIDFNLDASGRLDNVKVKTLDAGMAGVFGITAQGEVRNALDIDRLAGQLDFSGKLTDPRFADNLLGKSAVRVPRLTITGKARAASQTYSANFRVATEAGDVAAEGAVSLGSEHYRADVGIHNLNIAFMMPDLGVGRLNARLQARGAGFNPTLPNAATDIKLEIPSVQYHRQTLRDIRADITLHKGVYDIHAISQNAAADFDLTGTGTVAPDLYTFDVAGTLNHLDLHAIGMSGEPESGHGSLHVAGSASPERWLYDVDLTLTDAEWVTGNQVINLPGSVTAHFKSSADRTDARVDALLTSLQFGSPVGLKPLMDAFTATADSIDRQVKRRDVDFGTLQGAMPPFDVRFAMSGRGMAGRYLNTMGISLDTLGCVLRNDSLLSGRLAAINVSNGTTRADTLSLTLNQRGNMLDYLAHMGNRPGNPIGEFADVNLKGYLGHNRALVSLTQKNQKGETGYRLGTTASFADSVATLHFTPLKATIAYLPWTFNADNHIDVNFNTYHIDADLIAESRESKIHLLTEPGKEGNDELVVGLTNLKLQDFLRMSVFAPPVTATVNADLRVGYTKNWLYGGGKLGVNDFTYNRMRVGDFDLDLGAAHNNDGTSAARALLKIDGSQAMTARVKLVPDSVTHELSPERFGIQLTRFPLYIANAFLGPDIARLSGYLNGGLNMAGSFAAPVLNGSVVCDSVGVYVPMIGSQLKFNNDSVTVADNVIGFEDFDVWGANRNPLVINGTVDAGKLSAVTFDLDLKGKNFQLMGNDKTARSDLYGKLFADIDASARGPMEHFSVNADVTILPATDLTYAVSSTTAQMQSQDMGDVVKFVNFSDTTEVEKPDTVAPAMSMRIVAKLNIDPGCKVAVTLPAAAGLGGGKALVNPSGSLNYFQNYMGDMRLNGQIYTGEGYVRYSIPVSGEKKFDFNPESNVLFNGDIMNPVLNISATDVVKANLLQNGNTRLVNFLVGLDVSGTLSAPKVEFNLSTEDDMTIQNDLLSMSADQRSMTAINLLLTGQYNVQGVKTASADLLGSVTGAAYGLLTSQLNGWLANHVKGVDLSFGVDQYETANNGQTGTTTSYSYQVSKTLLNNKFKISVGGNYTTDASADENFSENLISDISFEYLLKQTRNSTMYVRLFRHTGYESILEGEITEMGAGFVLRRRLATLRELFRLGHRREEESPVPARKEEARSDTLKAVKPENTLDEHE